MTVSPENHPQDEHGVAGSPGTSAVLDHGAESHGHAGDGHGDHGHGHHPFQAHHFDTMEQQFDAGKLGMWLFLITEVLFFSGLFCAYAVFRANHPEVFRYAHQFLDVNMGALNTVVLLFSSLTMALAVRCAQLGQQKGLVINLILTLLCAFGFLVVKYFEYSHKAHEGLLWAGKFSFDPSRAHGEHGSASGHDGAAGHHAEATSAGSAEHHETADGHGHGGSHGPMPKNIGIFFSIYFCLTGLHGIHILGGMAAISWILYRSIKGHFGPQYYGPVDYVGLYWHLVDLIWIYLFPLLYLIKS